MADANQPASVCLLGWFATSWGVTVWQLYFIGLLHVVSAIEKGASRIGYTQELYGFTEVCK